MVSSGEDSAGAYSLVAVDLDKDGDQDLIVASNGNDRVTLWRNDGSGRFEKTIIFDQADFVLSVTAVDFDRDGDLDVASASFFDGHINWYENVDGEGREWRNHTIYVGFQGHYVSYGDIDGDGDDDLIASMHAENTVQVFLSKTECDADTTDGTHSLKKECCHVGTEWDGQSCRPCPMGTYGTGEGLTAKCASCPTDSCVIPGLNVVPATCSNFTRCPHLDEELALCSCPTNTTKSKDTDVCTPCPEGQIRPDTDFSRDMSSLGNYTAWEEQQGTCEVIELVPTTVEKGSLKVSVSLGLVCFLLMVIAVLLCMRKRESVAWKIDEKELKYDEPPVKLGRGGFGVVYLAEYRGTQVAVKKLYGQRTKSSSATVGRTWKSSQTRNTHNTKGVVKKQNDDSSTEESNSPFRTMHSMNAVTTVTNRKRGKFFNKESEGYALTDFSADMRVLSSLRHPSICAIMGAVVRKNKSEPFLVMEYVENKSLADLLQKSTVELEPEVIMELLCDISQGVQFLHNAKPQVVHGDIKSHNVLIDSHYRAKISDFGVSYKVGIKGTPFWMAPELLRDEKSECTAASDVYSFGITLYEIYSRQNPVSFCPVALVAFRFCKATHRIHLSIFF